MTFELVMGTCGKFIDKIIVWHLGLPLTFQFILYGVYLISIMLWVLRIMPRIEPY